MRILEGVPLGGASNKSEVVDGCNFWRFEWLLFRKLPRYYTTILSIYYPLLAFYFFFLVYI